MIFTVTLNPALDKEYQVPKLIIDEIMRMSHSRIDFGGKGFNVSRMLQSLGVDSIALGFVGGHTGEILVEGLRGLGIQIEPSPIIGETRTNISIVGESDSHYVKINEKGPSVSQDEVDALLQKINTMVRPDDFWVLSGSIPTDVPDDIYAKIINQVNRVGAFAILDTSGIPLRIGIEEKPYLIKPNIHELSFLVNRDIKNLDDLTEVLSELHTHGLRTILVSLGEAGAFLSDGLQRWRGQPPKIKVQNPIGAGDAMVAGLVWRMSEGDSMSAALSWSIACGTAAANTPGTGMPSLDIVREVKEQVEIEEL